MPLMEETHYLPEEKLTASNYPELIDLKADMDKIESFSEKVNSAVAWYNEAIYDKIYLEVTEIQEHVTLCRSICEKLANAPKVCYEVLLHLRELQHSFQELIYMKRRYGDEYVGTPSSEEDRYEGGVI